MHLLENLGNLTLSNSLRLRIFNFIVIIITIIIVILYRAFNLHQGLITLHGLSQLTFPTMQWGRCHYYPHFKKWKQLDSDSVNNQRRIAYLTRGRAWIPAHAIGLKCAHCSLLRSELISALEEARGNVKEVPVSFLMFSVSQQAKIQLIWAQICPVIWCF